MKILIIEDDNGLNKGISFALEQERYDVCSAFDLKKGFRFFGESNYETHYDTVEISRNYILYNPNKK